MRTRALAAGLLAACALAPALSPAAPRDEAPGLLPDHAISVPQVKFAPSEYVCRRAPGPVTVDGRLDEAAWRDADWTPAFVDILGPARPEPRFRTVVQMLWDDEAFYVGAFLEEPHVWATLTERDSVIFQDNDFEVFIDPDGDTHDYAEIELNALNTVWDLLLVKPYRDGGPAVDAWDIPGLRTAVRVNGTLNDPSDRDKSWTVEIAVPFAALRQITAGRPERPRPGDRWRVNFSRVEYFVKAEGGTYAKAKDAGTGQPLPEDNWTWTPQGIVNIHYPEMWGYVQFSGKPAGRGGERFAGRPEDDVLWTLRRAYYAQRILRLETGRFAPDWAALALPDAKALKVKGFSFPPKVQATGSLFEASMTGRGGETWHVREDGRVWKSGAEAK